MTYPSFFTNVIDLETRETKETFHDARHSVPVYGTPRDLHREDLEPWLTHRPVPTWRPWPRSGQANPTIV